MAETSEKQQAHQLLELLKQQAHRLVDQLDAGQLAAVVYLLQVMTDPMGRGLRLMIDPVARSLANAPVDDEPVTAEEAREIAAARASLDRGEGIPHEGVLAEFGLSLEDFESLGRTPLDHQKTGR
jgi:hypothetical protein